MDISLQPVESYQSEDRSWLASAHGTDSMQTVTLNVSTFDPTNNYPNGFIPSGTVLGKITATGLYGPYDDTASDGRQTAAGFLYSNTKCRSGGPNVGASIHWHGAVRTSHLPISGHPGALDANGTTDLASKFLVM